MKTLQVVLVLIAVIVVAGGMYYFFVRSMPAVSQSSFASSTSQTASSTASSTSGTPNPTVSSTVAGMSEYSDLTYGFTFWYPSALQVVPSTTDDSASFPGGTEVEKLQVGPEGAITIAVVNSPASTITDEPFNHASPIPQTKYFYDEMTGKLMVTYPQGADGGNSATTTVKVSKTTISGLPMLPSGLRFDATIIPLSTTRFLVINDGEGAHSHQILRQQLHKQAHP